LGEFIANHQVTLPPILFSKIRGFFAPSTHLQKCNQKVLKKKGFYMPCLAHSGANVLRLFYGCNLRMDQIG
jgi:hypothetical protein